MKAGLVWKDEAIERAQKEEGVQRCYRAREAGSVLRDGLIQNSKPWLTEADVKGCLGEVVFSEVPDLPQAKDKIS